MKRITLIAAASLLFAACGATATPPPMPTPQVVRVEVPVPGPVVTKTVEVPGPTIFQTPQSCLDALDANAKMWQMQQRFVDYLVDKATWSKADSKAFGALVDKFTAARDLCWAEPTPSS